jgi:hypothetical protein
VLVALNASTADCTVLYLFEPPTARQPAGAVGRPARVTSEAGAAMTAVARAKTRGNDESIVALKKMIFEVEVMK